MKPLERRLLVAHAVRDVMVLRGVTGGQLATALGATEDQVGALLAGEIPFDANQLERAASGLNVDVLDLFNPGGES